MWSPGQPATARVNSLHPSAPILVVVTPIVESRKQAYPWAALEAVTHLRSALIASKGGNTHARFPEPDPDPSRDCSNHLGLLRPGRGGHSNLHRPGNIPALGRRNDHGRIRPGRVRV